jgi:hypothetical protein
MRNKAWFKLPVKDYKIALFLLLLLGRNSDAIATPVPCLFLKSLYIFRTKCVKLINYEYSKKTGGRIRNLSSFL